MDFPLRIDQHEVLRGGQQPGCIAKCLDHTPVAGPDGKGTSATHEGPWRELILQHHHVIFPLPEPPVQLDGPEPVPPADVVANEQDGFIGIWSFRAADFKIVKHPADAPAAKGLPPPSAGWCGGCFNHGERKKRANNPGLRCQRRFLRRVGTTECRRRGGPIRRKNKGL